MRDYFQPAIREDIEFQTELYASDRQADSLQLRRYLKNAILQEKSSFDRLDKGERRELRMVLEIVRDPITFYCSFLSSLDILLITTGQ